jgi:hypothetical protein
VKKTRFPRFAKWVNLYRYDADARLAGAAAGGAAVDGGGGAAGVRPGHGGAVYTHA